MTVRANPYNLHCSESANVCAKWTYKTDRPLSIVMADQYFLGCRDQLQVGDAIRVACCDKGRVTHVVELFVVDGGRGARFVDVQAVGPVIEVPPSREQPAVAAVPKVQAFVDGDAEAVWNVGARAYDVKRGSTVVAKGIKDKETAWQIAKGDIPVPEQEAA